MIRMSNPLMNVDNSIIGSNSPTMITTEMDGGDEKGEAEVCRKRNRSGRRKAKAGAGESSEHDIHIWTERERRKKMRNMFAGLHALLPQLPAKVDKSTIVDEAVSYIKSLEQTVQTLQNQKMERERERVRGCIVSVDHDHEQVMISPQSQSVVSRESFMADHPLSNTSSPTNTPSNVPPTFQTWFSPNVVLSMTGDDAHICICSPRKPALFTTILYILHKHKLEVVSAHISSHHYRCMYMIHAHASEVSRDQFPEAFSVEDVFKLAVGEMNLWLLSC